jgi:redox-sensitive bicupin YhaK (pirin superfamily)
MSNDPILSVQGLSFPWQTFDPFLFCAYHDDAYPEGNADMGPSAPLSGRRIGQDFSRKDGWSMYHGQVVPGFPSHPHRGFETVTLARKGFIDHSDSLGATARFGKGDVQWMTAGHGIVHAEMFPLRQTDRSNPVELFQIWLNLPAAKKYVDPHFTMMWGSDIPRKTFTDSLGRATEVVVVAGALEDLRGPPPPPDSWASDPEHHVAIWTLELEPGATFTLPQAPAGVRRTLYLFEGDEVQFEERTVSQNSLVMVRPDQDVTLTNGGATAQLLMLQGRPIAEPVAQHGPFVMNTRAELQQAYDDYRRTRFGGWPWPSSAPVHPRASGRFAIHADGREEKPG